MHINKKTSKMQGFTLPEMLISLALGLMLSVILVKIYLWQADLHHHMEDMIFLDHNSILVMNILAHAVRKAKSIDIVPQKIITDTVLYKIQNHEFHIKEAKNQKSVAVISGVNKLAGEFVNNNQALKIQVEMSAPHGMTEKLQEVIVLENKFS